MKVLIIQPWGIGDVLMSIKPVEELRNRGCVIDLLSAQTSISKFLSVYGYIDNFQYIKWTNNKLFNFLRLFLFILKSRRVYQYIVVPDRLSSIIIVLSEWVFNAKVYSNKSIPKEKYERSRIKNNQEIIRQICSEIDKFKKIEIREKWIQRKTEQHCKGGGVAFFLSASEDFKAINANVARGVCEELLRNNVKIFEITDGKSYKLEQLVIDVIKVPYMEFSEMADFFKTIDCVVAGDTGVAHFAAFCNVPVVMVVGPTDAEKTSPLGAELIWTDEAMNCVPCYETPLYGNCPYELKCMTSVDHTKISEAIRKFLLMKY